MWRNRCLQTRLDPHTVSRPRPSGEVGTPKDRPEVVGVKRELFPGPLNPPSKATHPRDTSPVFRPGSPLSGVRDEDSTDNGGLEETVSDHRYLSRVMFTHTHTHPTPRDVLPPPLPLCPVLMSSLSPLPSVSFHLSTVVPSTHRWDWLGSDDHLTLRRVPQNDRGVWGGIPTLTRFSSYSCDTGEGRGERLRELKRVSERRVKGKGFRPYTVSVRSLL